MNVSRTVFKIAFKPIAKRAVRGAIVGRNRARGDAAKGRFTVGEVNELLDESWRAFDDLDPDVSREPTFGSRLNVQLAALTLAFLRALMEAGVERDYAIELIGDTCWSIYQYWGRIGRGRFLARLVPSPRSPEQEQVLGADGSWPLPFPFNPPGYRARGVPVKDGVGFDVIRCPVADYFHEHGAADLAVNTWCMLDYPLAEMLDLRLVRSQTLARGDKLCDFRWLAAEEATSN